MTQMVCFVQYLRSMDLRVHLPDHGAAMMAKITLTRRLRFHLDHHIDEDDLELYALGRITDEDRLAPIEEHLLACDVCQDRLRREDQVVREVRVALRMETACTPTWSRVL
jgi:hypothetical protein